MQHTVLKDWIWWGIGNERKHIPAEKFKQMLFEEKKEEQKDGLSCPS